MRTIRSLAWLSLALSTSANADMRVTFEQQGECSAPFTKMQISGSQLRIDHKDGSMLYDGLEETAIHLDHLQKRWMELEVDADAADYTADVASSSLNRAERELAKAQQQMVESCKQLESQGIACPQMPAMDMQAMMQMGQAMARQADARSDATPKSGNDSGQLAAPDMDPEALQDMLARTQGGNASPSDTPATPHFVDTGRDERLAAGTCRWHEERAGEILLRSVCVALPSSMSLGERDRDGLVNAMKVLQRFAAALAPWQTALTGRTEAGADPTNQGLALVQHCFNAKGKIVGSAEAQVSNSTINPASFEIPEDYRQQDMTGG